MPIGPARMPLLDHLGELRRRLTIVVVSLLATAIVVYAATPTLIDFMIDPIRSSLPEGANLTVLSVLGGFTIRFKVALFFGMIICAPIIIWETMAFFLPALKPSERKWVVPTVGAMVALFFMGMTFCYFIIQKAAIGWMIDQTAQFASVIADAEDYLNIMMLLEIGFGLAFQLPLVIFYLSILHIVPYKTFRSNWRYIYVGLMLLSGVVTPDASPVTMVLMFAALVGLYELALAFARYILIARDGKESLKWSREEYEEHKFEEELKES
ncbi:MAG: twin-arginine translocase subunit TatC [Olsenella sp.]|nr:twin-arginine translocase subunit TatC [Olsenella sp.]